MAPEFPELTTNGAKLKEALVSPIIGHHTIRDVAGEPCVMPCQEAVKVFLDILRANINHVETEEALRQSLLVHVCDWKKRPGSPYNLEAYFAAYTSAANTQFPDTLNNEAYRKVHMLLHKVTSALLDE